jgi:hypothetical protein
MLLAFFAFDTRQMNLEDAKPCRSCSKSIIFLGLVKGDSREHCCVKYFFCSALIMDLIVIFDTSRTFAG